MTLSATTPNPPSQKHISAIDGLRAIAVMGVFFFHLRLPGFQWGASGVQLFFVISGFLITGILIDTISHPHYFKNFYIRRSLRIFPIYYLTLILLSIWGLARGYDISAQYLPYFFTYTHNYIQAYHQYQLGFWIMLPHTWSLAIEEQFYLLWPLLLFIFRPKSLPILCVVLIVIALLWRTITAQYSEFDTKTWVYAFALPSHLDTLAVGGLITWGTRRFAKRSMLIAAFIGIVLGGLFYFVMPNFFTPGTTTHLFWARNIHYYFGGTALALFYGGWLIYAIYNVKPICNLLNMAWLRFIGKISYGIYLYHMILHVMLPNLLTPLTNLLPPAWQIVGIDVLTVAATFIVSVLSWYLIEQPINRQKDRFAAYSNSQQ